MCTHVDELSSKQKLWVELHPSALYWGRGAIIRSLGEHNYIFTTFQNVSGGGVVFTNNIYYIQLFTPNKTCKLLKKYLKIFF